jgi:transposase
MRDTTLMQQALGLTPPWTVVRSDFDTAAGRLDVEIDFTPGSRFACPTCGAADCPAYESQRKTWRHLNFFQHQAYLNARVPRVRCETWRHQTGQRPLGKAGQWLHAAVRSDGDDHGLGHAGQGRGAHRR